MYQVANGLITTWTKFQVVLESYRGFIGIGGPKSPPKKPAWDRVKINSALRMKYKPEEQKIKYKIKKDKINFAKRMKYKADKAKSSNKGEKAKFSNNHPEVFKLGENMRSFHKSLEMTIMQCNVCFEAWPLSNSTKASQSEYVCRRCKIDKKVPKKFSSENNMIPSKVPFPLQNLTQVEEMLIARAFPVLQVYTKPRGGQRYIKVITLPQDVQEIADILPRHPKDIPVIVFDFNNKNNASIELKVRRQNVLDALIWLTGVSESGEPNNFMYKDIVINYETSENLPQNGYLDLTSVDFKSNDECEDDNGEDLSDFGPLNDEDRVYDKSTELGSFVPAKVGCKKESDIIEEEVLQVRNCNPEWTVGSEALNEFGTEYLASLAFPSLFPDTKGDPTNLSLQREIASSETQSFSEKIKHLIKFAEQKGNLYYRFAAHPRFAFWAYNMLYRRRLLGQGSFYIKQNPSDANLTLNELQEMVQSGTHEVFQSDEYEMLQQSINEGKSAEDDICNYVDSIVTAMNPSPPINEEWVKPDFHPCKRRFNDIPPSEFEEDYADLANLVQRHTLCNSAYCLRKGKGDNTVQYCRFKFPFETCESTHIEYEEIHTKNQQVAFRPKIVLKRNDPRINRHQRLQLQSWRANIDIQPIIDHNACLEYIAKYASKAEKLSTVVRDAFVNVIGNLKTTDSTHKVIRKLMIKAVGERDFSAQEVMHHILSLKLLSSSFQVISTSLDGSRKVTIKNDNVETKPSTLDNYANRSVFEGCTAEVLQCNFVNFVAKYTLVKDEIKKRSKTVVVRTYPNYYSNPKGAQYPMFCKYQLN